MKRARAFREPPRRRGYYGTAYSELLGQLISVNCVGAVNEA